ncbi:TorF family putative porin [Sphingomonas qilianensis]|uniref:TorF family putative porin n=1 Tax=Sphingomonas qilianensis TaxID=1736690 RepID=A0ABU9XT24_9SPHN
MTQTRSGVFIAAAALALSAHPAAAQRSPSAGVEFSNDEVRRGLSWSGGRAALSTDVWGVLGPVEASARAATTRGSERHAGADAVIDVALASSWNLGPLQMRTGLTGHLFTGAREAMDYAELGASASYSYGPAQLTGGVEFAPSQDAIGGSNLHLYVNANAGIPGTPFTLIAGLGHSSGSTSDPVRAQRLRPDGNYANWRLGAEHRRGALTLAVDYLGTDISRGDFAGPYADRAHASDRIIGRIRYDF